VARQNPFKNALTANRVQLGIWLALADPTVAEICAGSEADWLLIDAEHAPNDIRSITAQLQAIGARAHPIVRPPNGESWHIKHALDAGAQTLMIPMVESAAQAAALVQAIRYPPHGNRGVASSLARASDYGREKAYLDTADENICLLVMIETKRGVERCEDILSVEGVDGAFFGAADLAADLGCIGQHANPAVIAAMESGIATARRLGKGAGAFATPRTAARLIDLGATFLSVGADVSVLTAGADAKVRAMAEFTRRQGGVRP
jgi:4-hydroxy-2-oxoheptanedioate aldolase